MSSLVAHSSIQELFRSLLGEALSERRLEITDETEFYLVNLLAEFMRSEKLFSEEQEGRRNYEPLAILYHKATQQTREERIRTLRRLGDVSLYVSGFFGDALRQGAVGPDYYIQMGKTAYAHVAELVTQGGFAGTYRELGGKFRDFVQVLEEIAARGLVSGGPQGVLKVYETWARSHSGGLERVLVGAGLLPKSSSLPN